MEMQNVEKVSEKDYTSQLNKITYNFIGPQKVSHNSKK